LRLEAPLLLLNTTKVQSLPPLDSFGFEGQLLLMIKADTGDESVIHQDSLGVLMCGGRQAERCYASVLL
jgi:hypothetical protein